MLLYGEGNGNPPQYPCLENLMDREAWWAAVHGSQRVSHDWATNTHTHTHNAPIISCSYSYTFYFIFASENLPLLPWKYIFIYQWIVCVSLPTVRLGVTWANLPCICFILLPLMYLLNLLICCLICMGCHVFHFLLFSLNQTCQFLDIQFNSVQFSRSVMSNSLRPHGLQHARAPCPSQTPRVYSDSCPQSQWCHWTISSSVIPFSSCLQSFQH